MVVVGVKREAGGSGSFGGGGGRGNDGGSDNGVEGC